MHMNAHAMGVWKVCPYLSPDPTALWLEKNLTNTTSESVLLLLAAWYLETMHAAWIPQLAS